MWDPPDSIPNSEVKPRSVSSVSVVFGHVKLGKLAIYLNIKEPSSRQTTISTIFFVSAGLEQNNLKSIAFPLYSEELITCSAKHSRILSLIFSENISWKYSKFIKHLVLFEEE